MSAPIVVSDAGPLLALAKLDALELLVKLYGAVCVSPAVFSETVSAGLARKAHDAVILQDYFDRNALFVRAVESSRPLVEPTRIQRGERESIQLAISLGASEFLVDDLHARQVAEQNFLAADNPITVRGTLGIIYLGFQKSMLSSSRAIQLVESLKDRRDIWISAKLCDQVLQLIRP